MGLFGLFGKKREDSAAERRRMAKRLDGMALKYVVERDSDEAEGADGEVAAQSGAAADRVIGRSGALILKEDRLLVYSDADVIFRARVDSLSMGMLLSGDGVILEGNDEENGGRHRKIIAYFTYYLKT